MVDVFPLFLFSHTRATPLMRAFRLSDGTPCDPYSSM